MLYSNNVKQIGIFRPKENIFFQNIRFITSTIKMTFIKLKTSERFFVKSYLLDFNLFLHRLFE